MPWCSAYCFKVIRKGFIKFSCTKNFISTFFYLYSMKKWILAVLGLITTVFSIALAVPTPANLTVGTQETYAYSPAVTTVTTQGGNITQINVTSVQVTDKWAGFYGHVSGSIVLADASGDYLYQWTIANINGGFVYAANTSVSNWTCANIVPVAGPSDTYLPSFLITGSDAYNYTFTTSESVSIPLGCPAQLVNYTTTNPGTFKTYALKAITDNALIWAGLINANQSSFNGGTADYQILAGVDSTTGTTTYYFYLELP